MIANLGPAAMNFDETISTLRYADRAKQIKNKPIINEDPKDTKLREMQDEINQLKAMLEARKNGVGVGGAVNLRGAGAPGADGDAEVMLGMNQLETEIEE